MSDQQTTDIVARLHEGRTDGTHLRWAVTDIHREAAAEIMRLRAIIRVNALRYEPNISHKRIDEVIYGARS